ncbi:MAG: hypothetical protein ACKVP0_12305 [Pirellulaceae bacterium]
MKAVYLLPCSCGKKVRVDAGQAGAKVDCECGQQLAVPTFRGLRNLEVDGTATALAKEGQKAPWNVQRGVLFSFGLLVTVVAFSISSFHLYKYSLLRDGGESWKKSHLEEMSHGVEHLSPVEVLAEFQEMSKKGLTVDGIPPWAMITSMRDTSIRWLAVSLAVLAVGLVSLGASLIGIRRPKKSP